MPNLQVFLKLIVLNRVKLLNMTLWKDKSLVIIGCGLVLNNLFDEYSGSSYSYFLLWLNPPKVRKSYLASGKAKSTRSCSSSRLALLYLDSAYLVGFPALMILNLTL